MSLVFNEANQSQKVHVHLSKKVILDRDFRSDYISALGDNSKGLDYSNQLLCSDLQ